MFCSAISVNGQDKKSGERERRSPATVILKGAGTAAVIVVGQTGKSVWAVTKFAAKDIAKPIAVTILKTAATKIAPRAAKFVGKNSFKYALPLVIKLSVL